MLKPVFSPTTGYTPPLKPVETGFFGQMLTGAGAVFWRLSDFIKGKYAVPVLCCTGMAVGIWLIFKANREQSGELIARSKKTEKALNGKAQEVKSSTNGEEPKPDAKPEQPVLDQPQDTDALPMGKADPQSLPGLAPPSVVDFSSSRTFSKASILNSLDNIPGDEINGEQLLLLVSQSANSALKSQTL